MITLHHLTRSRSKRVTWLFEELNTPYNLIKHTRDSQTNLAPQSLKDIHPLGKAPIIVDGDTILCESSSIMEYILDQDQKQRLRPAKNTPAYYRYLEWSHFAEGSLSLPLITKLFMSMEQRDGQKPMDAYINKEIGVDFSYIENTLSKQPYFAGEAFTAADIMMTISLEIAASIGVLAEKTHTLAYLDKIQKRVAYIKASAIG
ncbi:glutathione S-transferase [Marinomonas sp. 15G1-11]|uniref:Glutathione S-transferase n=1 Tax=Marinomonas phaeophyticola TaxID=3004091 RepID=A0ABT4JQY3_9GAMM|nr:glutathione S-transferase [Marinomonas sp. 15G1-11]MCZ2720786.1 glutathione S-transferase [Marinomonas sp. 15G1-11]